MEKSPDITPNGSLRRRRSRVLSEEDEGNLMDFLRSSGHDSNRERRGWGSLDRSWSRKARGSSHRKRPALLGADFSSDRERPSSPSPLSESKPILSAPEEDETKPKELRLKIESWLQASDQSDQKSGKRLVNRRSIEMDSESERSGTLDTLPEGKQVYSGSQSNYRKVYHAWEPSKTIDNTDVVGAMETVEEVQPLKDKSAWRKSTLNVANSTEETKDDLPAVRLHVDDTSDRKSLINSLASRGPTDKLTLYIIKSPKTKSIPSSPAEEREQLISNKVEIDQDNIETPPATRKIFIPTPTEKRETVQPSPCKRLMGRAKDNPPEESDSNIGDGQFDRFSATRRTRRYRRSTDTVDPEENNTNPHDEDRESRLKVWQDKLKVQSDTDSRSKRHRHQTGINQEEVKIALREKIDIPTKKHREHTDNDEGFEESQSLMSESPSQGASSGGNYEPDESTHIVVPAYKKPKPLKASETKLREPIKIVKPKTQLDRANSVRRPIQETPKKSVIPRRSGSLRQADVQRSSSRSSIVSSRSSLNSATSTNTVKRAPIKIATAVPSSRTQSIAGSKPRSAIGTTSGTTKPPRPLVGMSFMKPTTSSTTKSHSTGMTSKATSGFKSKH